MRKEGSRQSGFSLVELSIILGVAGLVIAGIWAASGAVKSSRRYAEIYADTIKIALDTSKAYRLSQYATTLYDGTNVTQEVKDAGLLPTGYSVIQITNPSNVDAFVSPSGFTGSVILGKLTSGPATGIILYTNRVNGVTQGISNADCMQLIAKFLSTGQNLITELWVSTPLQKRYQVLTPPWNLSTYSQCPTNVSAITFFIKP